MELTESDVRALAHLSLPDDATLRRRLDPATVTRGTDYARRGMVQRLHVDPGERALFATVRGSGASSYQSFVVLGPGGEPAIHCTCPVRADCKHGVAAILAARGAAVDGVRADWERALDEAVTEDVDAGEPLGLQLERVVGRGAAVATGRAAARIRLVPVVLGAKGTWVRTGVSWQAVRWSWSRFVPDHAEALRAIIASHHNTYAKHVHLDDLGTPVWALLRQAVDAGVSLVPHRGLGGEVVLSPTPAEVTLDVTTHPVHDGVRVSPVVRVGGRTAGAHAVAFVGHPVHGVAVTGDGLLLAPLARPLPAGASELVTGESIHIPPDGVERFRRDFYPRLRRLLPVSSSDRAVELPDVLTPVLLLSVAHLPGFVVRLSWSLGYHTRDGVTVVPAGHPPHDDDVPAAGWVRDLPRESRLLDEVVLPPGLPQLHATAPRRGPAPVVELHRLDAARFTQHGLPQLREDNPAVVVEVSGEAPDYRHLDVAPTVRLTATDSPVGDWFDMEVAVEIDGEPVPFGHLFRALATHEQELFLPSGAYISLDRPELEQLRRLIKEAGGLQDEQSGTVQVTPYQADLWQELQTLGVVDSQSERWRRTVSALLSGPPPGAVEVPAGLRADLRTYQREGFEWLATLWDAGLGGILADDMGLGKTLQTLAVVQRAKETGRLDHPVLVVAPTSVVGGWAGEAERFTPGLTVRTVEQTSAKAGVPLAEHVAGADVVVTSYALLRLDFASYDALDWSALVLDEAQFVKNHQAKTHVCARRLAAPVKLAISGTPLENSLMDLWALLSITAPGLFPDPRAFTEQYRTPIERDRNSAALDRLRRRTGPFIRRRTKEEVATELPPKQEQVLSVALTPRHRKIYDTHLARERRKILGLVDDLDKNRFTIFRSLTLLRQLALAPALVDTAYEGVASSKAEAFLEHLDEVVAEGHRALVFSQFTGYLGLVRERLEQQGIDHCYLDGTTRNRPARIREFKEGHAPVFLISLKAGGVGLNLTEADYCFLLDPWWNPAVEAQAIDRTHRIGQERAVMVYRMVAEGTIEEKVMALAERKRELAGRVLSGGQAGASAPLSADDIRDLLG